MCERWLWCLLPLKSGRNRCLFLSCGFRCVSAAIYQRSREGHARFKLGYGSLTLFLAIRSCNGDVSWPAMLVLKTKLISFIASQWKKSSIREKLGGKTMYVTCDNLCFKLTRDEDEMHAKHAASSSCIVHHHDSWRYRYHASMPSLP